MATTARLFRTTRGLTLELDRQCFDLPDVAFDDVFRRGDPLDWLRSVAQDCRLPETAPSPGDLLPPIGSQEVWGAGVTYYHSRSARIEESSEAGGSDFYDRVYSAQRPELFFKANPHRVVGHRRSVRIRSDAKWTVPEPELTACISAAGQIVGYTVGNDMCSRDIEGENPLYLPQAKIYDGCCALGPCILLTNELLPDSTEVGMTIYRNAAEVFSGSTRLQQMKRKLPELIEYLFRDNSFPTGCFLLTGTGIVPPSDFTLQSGDEIRICIEPIGTLKNTVV
jgi:2-dehydro-3-deoxy-D-arabinonate dehydratase